MRASLIGLCLSLFLFSSARDAAAQSAEGAPATGAGVPQNTPTPSESTADYAKPTSTAAPMIEQPRADTQSPLVPWRKEDTQMNSPGAFGVGVGLGSLGVVTTAVALGLIAKGGSGLEGGYFNSQAIGYVMLAPGGLLLIGGTVLAIVGARPVMRSSAGLEVRLSPTGAIYGTF